MREYEVRFVALVGYHDSETFRVHRKGPGSIRVKASHWSHAYSLTRKRLGLSRQEIDIHCALVV